MKTKVIIIRKKKKEVKKKEREKERDEERKEGKRRILKGEEKVGLGFEEKKNKDKNKREINRRRCCA